MGVYFLVMAVSSCCRCPWGTRCFRWPRGTQSRGCRALQSLLALHCSRRMAAGNFPTAMQNFLLHKEVCMGAPDLPDGAQSFLLQKEVCIAARDLPDWAQSFLLQTEVRRAARDLPGLRDCIVRSRTRHLW